jgi:hypothetical protein
VTADDKSKIYGEVDPVLTATVSGTLGSDTVTYELEREPGENPGVYKIIATGDSEQGNYAVTFVPGAFTIEPDPNVIIVTADDKSKTYAEDDPELTVTITGKADLPAISYTISREAGEDVGTYVITVTGDSEQGGYRIVFVDGVFLINYREATVAADTATKVVGADDPEFHARVTGVLPADFIEYEIIRGEGEDIGYYYLYVVGESIQGNYHVNFESAYFMITSEPTVEKTDDGVIETTEDHFVEHDMELTVYTQKFTRDDGYVRERVSITAEGEYAEVKLTFIDYVEIVTEDGDETVTHIQSETSDGWAELRSEMYETITYSDGTSKSTEWLQSVSKDDHPIAVSASADAERAKVEANLTYIDDKEETVTESDIDSAVERMEKLAGGKEWYGEALKRVSVTCAGEPAASVHPTGFARMSELGLSFTIHSGKGTLSYDSDVAKRLSREFSEVYLSMELSNEDSLTPEQRKAMPERATFAVVLAGSEGVAIHDLGGIATVTFPFDNYGEWEIVNVFYMDDSGLSFPVPGAYYDPLTGMVYLETDHHSVFYAVGSNPSEVTDVVVTINQTEDHLSILLIADAGTVPHGTITVDISYAEYDDELELYVAGHETKDLRVEYDGYQAVVVGTMLSDMEHFSEAFAITATFVSDPIEERVISTESKKIQISQAEEDVVVVFASNSEDSLLCAIAPYGTHVIPAGTMTVLVSYIVYDEELEMYIMSYQTSDVLKVPGGEDIIFGCLMDLEWVEHPDSIFWYTVHYISEDGSINVYSNKTLFG